MNTPKPEENIRRPNFPPMDINPHSLLIEKDVFNNIETEDGFGELVKHGFDEDAHDAFLKLEYSVGLLHDAYQSYRWDTQRLDKNMPNSESPSHFKLSGCLAYWLRRNSPIENWKTTEEEHRITDDAKGLRKFISDYGRVYHPFMLGYRICWSFERNKEDGSPFLSTTINANYINTVCYYMKYKSVSPHALGLIYQSLFFV